MVNFRRGLTGSDAPGTVNIRGDRSNPADLARLVDAGPFDAVIDTSSYVPRETLAMARALDPVADKYVLVSTVSVYEDWPIKPLSESSPVLSCPSDAGPDYGYDGDPGPSTYGFGKAGCERAVLETFGPQRSVILRPGVILGPREYVGRLEWWLRRMQRGGRILAPGSPSRSIQPVDVRDVSDFALHAAGDLWGIFDVVAAGRDTMGDLLDACHNATGKNGRLEWITDETWLADQGVTQWTELPLWRTYKGAWSVDGARARASGLTCRPIRETVADTWSWIQQGGTAIDHERASELGMSPGKEAALLAMWDADQSDRCGA